MKNIRNKIIVLLLIIIAIIAAVCYANKDESIAGENLGSLQGIVLKDMYGKPYALSNLKGHNVYIKLWASWCPVCTSGLGKIETLSTNSNKDFQVITVVFPNQNGEKSIEDFRKWYEVAGKPNTIVLFDTEGQLAKLANLRAFPTNMFVDKNLDIKQVILGDLSNENIMSIMSKTTGAKNDGSVTSEATPIPTDNNGNYARGNLRVIYLAGGCFWGVQAFFDRVPGVISTEVGYANGKWNNPSYEDLKLRHSGHAETVKVTYDTKKISLTNLLRYYFKAIDPTAVNHQGGDYGVQYRSGIYYVNPEDKQIAEEVIAQEQKKYKEKIAVEVVPLKRYDPAEDYHQEYIKKHPYAYCHIDLSQAEKGLSDD